MKDSASSRGALAPSNRRQSRRSGRRGPRARSDASGTNVTKVRRAGFSRLFLGTGAAPWVLEARCFLPRARPVPVAPSLAPAF